MLTAAQTRRAALRAQIAAEQAPLTLRRPAKNAEGPGRPVLMAVAAHKGRLSVHFGQAREFLIYEVRGTGIRLVGLRQIDPYCQGPLECGGQEDGLEQTIRALAGCEVVLCAKIGHEPWERLVAAGIQPNGEHPDERIESACLAVWHQMFQAGKLTDPQVSQVA